MHHDSTPIPATPGFTPSRRTALRTAAWAAPAVAVTAATPAFATSPGSSTPAWSVTSDSWRGSTSGIRSNIAYFDMNFAITPPPGQTLKGVTALLAFGLNRVGTQIYGSVTMVRSQDAVIVDNTWTRTTQGTATWSTSGAALGYSHTLTRVGDVSSSTFLRFHIASLGYVGSSDDDPDADTLGLITLKATGQPDRVFTLHRRNVNYALLPAPAVGIDYRTGQIATAQ